MTRLIRPRRRDSERDTTPEAVFWNRRAILAAGGGAAAVAGLAALGTGSSPRSALAEPTPEEVAARKSGMPAPDTPFRPMPARNTAIADARSPVTDAEVTSTYNNFYEFGSHKQIYEAAQALDTDGWTVRIDGMVEKEMKIGAEDLLAEMPMEERVIRHRCVEAWAMVIPWIGFPLKALMDRARPLSGAKYVRFESFLDPEIARGQRQHWYPWPYVEGLTMAEAAHPLSFMVMGAYGKVLPEQFGAPMRLHVPWKYGFKHNKSITRITFTDERPVSFWEELQASEYGFWANVNPKVDHPRWSQASERMLGTDERVPTELFNGYAEDIEGLYAQATIDEAGVRFWR